MRDEMRRLAGQGQTVAALFRPRFRPPPLMPDQRLAHRHDHRAVCEGAVSQLHILRAPAVKRCAAADALVERAAQAEVPADHDVEEIVRHRQLVVGAGEVALRPGRVRWQGRHQVAQILSPHRLDVQIFRRHMPAGPGRQNVGRRVVPSGMGWNPLLIDQFVRVEEQHDVVGGGGHAGVARPPSAVAATRLPQGLHLQRRGRRLQGRLGTIIDQDDFDEPARVALPFQRGQCLRQRGRRHLVAGNHQAHRLRGHEGRQRGDRKTPPIVVRHLGGGRRHRASLRAVHPARRNPKLEFSSMIAPFQRPSGTASERLHGLIAIR